MALAWQSIDLRSADPFEAEHLGDPQDLVDGVDTFLRLLQRPSWHARAACRGQGIGKWFPTKGQPAAPAVEVCESCPVRTECRAYALEVGPELDGVWAGTTPMSRRALRRTVA